MYFSKSRSGARTVVSRYLPYDKAKKRGGSELLGSIRDGIFYPSPTRADSITEAEMCEIQNHIAKKLDEGAKEARIQAVQDLPEILKRVADAVRNKETTEFSAEWAETFWSEIDTIGRALRKKKLGKWKVLRDQKGDETNG